MVRNSELKSDLLELNHRLDLIERVLLVTNPDGSMAAEAYDGLRKTIGVSLKATQVLEASLAQLDQISRSTDDMEIVRVKLRELMGIAKVELVEDHERYPEAFDVIGSGEVRTVAKPAYVALERGTIVARGVLELSSDITAEADATFAANLEDADVDEGAKDQSDVFPTEDRIESGAEVHSGGAEVSSTTTKATSEESK